MLQNKVLSEKFNWDPFLFIIFLLINFKILIENFIWVFIIILAYLKKLAFLRFPFIFNWWSFLNAHLQNHHDLCQSKVKTKFLTWIFLQFFINFYIFLFYLSHLILFLPFYSSKFLHSLIIAHCFSFQYDPTQKYVPI